MAHFLPFLRRRRFPSIFIFCCCLILFSTFLLFLLLVRVRDDPPQPSKTTKSAWDYGIVQNNLANDLQRITCVIDANQRVPCVRQDAHPQEIYVPFNKYLKKQFDLSGHFNRQRCNSAIWMNLKGIMRRKNRFAAKVFEPAHLPFFELIIDHFMILASTAKIRMPNWTNYEPLGLFEQFNLVALRPRVWCVDPITGVPMSTQWQSIPYFYPIQIVQYGLEHFNKNRTERPPIVRFLGEKIDVGGKKEERRADIGPNGAYLHLAGGDSVSVQLFAELAVLLLELETESVDSHFVVELEDRRSGRHIELIFEHSVVGGKEEKRKCVWRRRKNGAGRNRQKVMSLYFVYGLGPTPANAAFVPFVLDIPIYAAKSMAAMCAETTTRNGTEEEIDEEEAQAVCADWKNGSNANDFVPKLLHIRGPCVLKLHSLKQQSSAHSEKFLQVARWLLANQNSRGGWAVNVRRTINESNHLLVLQAGWHSAMAQGLALSFLTRAHSVLPADGNKRFLTAAKKALALFEVRAVEGGVVNQLFGRYPWFEEYPMQPGTFVLNGFIYALIGLHDFSAYSNVSKSLFDKGIQSLRVLLPLFDTGQRSLYDLRHIALHSRPNVARWAYHSLHVYQLAWLHSITSDPLFDEVANRWADYARGVAARHNK